MTMIPEGYQDVTKEPIDLIRAEGLTVTSFSIKSNQFGHIELTSNAGAIFRIDGGQYSSDGLNVSRKDGESDNPPPERIDE